MFHWLRRIARPCGTLAILVLLASALALDCRVIAAAAGHACCAADTHPDAALESGCCSLREAPSSTEQLPGTSASSRQLSPQAADPGGSCVVVAPRLPEAAHSTAALNATPPSERLYIRLSVIRR